MALMAKLDASHSRWKRPDLEGKASVGAEVMVFFNASKACCSAVPHDQSFNFQVCVEGASDFREVPDEPSVEVHKSYEGLDILYFCQLWPVCDSLDFNGVHHYTVFGDDEPKVVHLLTFKLGFLQSEKQLVGMEGLEYLLSDPPMVCEGCRADEDVIHVANSFIAIDKGVEDVIHHCLEGSW